MRLTDLAIQKLPVPDQGQKTHWEGGFGVRVSQGGSKSFVVMYGKERRLKTLGRYPAMSLKIARKQAQKYIVSVPSSRKQMTLSEARDAFMEEVENKNRPATVRSYRLYLDQLSKKRLEDVTRLDVPQKPHAIMAAKIFFNWCIRNQLVERNPFALERVSYNSRERTLTDDEIKKIWAYDFPPFSDILKFLLLTGQRRGQLSQFTISDDNIIFPAEIMKNKREHVLPLTPMARQLAEQIPYFNGWSRAKRRIDDNVDIPHWTIHDLRRTHSTIQASLGTPIHVTEAILSHTSGTVSGVARVYNRYNYLNEAREVLERFENHIQTLCG